MTSIPNLGEFRDMDHETRCTIMHTIAKDFREHERVQNGEIKQIKLMLVGLMVINLIGNHQQWIDIIHVLAKIMG